MRIGRNISIFQICVLILFSCSEENSKNTHPSKNQPQVHQEIQLPTFADVIPENLSDSSKSQIISHLVGGILLDTTLVRENYVDSIGNRTVVFYRNDSVVRIIDGSYPGFEFDKVPAWGSDFLSYYYLRDTLIALNYSCSTIQQTGMCNPVSAYSTFYFYNRKVILEHHNNTIGNYIHCGCHDLTPSSALGYKAYFFENLLDLDRLKNFKEDLLVRDSI